MEFVITILAGGEGKRMRSDLPKVLHIVKKKPMLVHILEAAASLCPDKICVITGRFHSQIIATLSEYMDISALVFIQQPQSLGTGNAVGCALSHFADTDRVVILNGDMPLLHPSIIDSLFYSYSDEYAEGAIVCAHLDNPTGYGRVIHINGTPAKIVEEASCTETESAIKLVNAGIYIFSGKSLKEYIPKITAANSKGEYYLTDIIGDMYKDKKRLISYVLKESENKYIRGVNTPEELAELDASLTNGTA